jgi:outer membrane cobalamin receptor
VPGPWPPCVALRLHIAIALLLLAPLAQGQSEILDPVVISAMRAPTPATSIPLAVRPIEGADFAEGPYLSADAVLMEAPEFSLFRRNTSLTANPTSQGVSLRGLGPSGTSRSLVVLDGLPLNDPFGGWIPWSMVPDGAIARAEVIPFGGAAAWGNAALSGVIALYSTQPNAGSGQLIAESGDFSTRSALLQQSVAAGPGVLSFLGDSFASTGFGLIADNQRGAIDSDAWSRHDLAQLQWSGNLGSSTHATARIRSFEEARGNGTPYQRNGMHRLDASGELAGDAHGIFQWRTSAYAESQSASQTFSSVNASRTAETPAGNQFAVPTTAVGLSASTTWGESGHGQTTLGGDLRSVTGETREDFGYTAGSYSGLRYAGGSERFEGIYLERVQPLQGSTVATVSVRADDWSESGGHQMTWVLPSGNPATTAYFPNRSGLELSPSAGITGRFGGLRWHAAAQRAFRVPTLNELYRPFRQGTTVTLANPALSNEHADSAEAGLSWETGRLSWSAEGFGARLDNPVANVTLAQGPGTFPLFGTLGPGAVGQQRQNLGRVTTKGLQGDVRWTASGSWTFAASVILEDAIVDSAPSVPVLVGKRVPEVPRWAGSGSVSYRPTKGLSISAEARSSGSEYDDDRNLLPLASATTLAIVVRYTMFRDCDVIASATNVLDTRVETSHSAAGVFGVGSPRIASISTALRW